MRHTRTPFALLLSALLPLGCADSGADDIALQVAGITAAVEETSVGPHERLCVAVLGLDGLDLYSEEHDPSPALLDALEAAGWEAVPASACGMPDDWNPGSGLPYTAMEDGTGALSVWVRELDPERPGRVVAGTLPWPMMEKEWDCAARESEGEWVMEDCETDTFD